LALSHWAIENAKLGRNINARVKEVTVFFILNAPK
jgi:hypothetical protein